MALTRRRLRRWHAVALTLIAGCGVWTAHQEFVRLRSPPDGWEEMLAGTWRACHPAPLVGKVEIQIEPPNRATLVHADLIAPALHQLYGVWPYMDPWEKQIKPSEIGNYTTTHTGRGVCEGEVWGIEPHRPDSPQGLVTLSNDHGKWGLLAYSVRGEMLLRLEYQLDRDMTDYRHVVFRKAQ